MNPPGGRELVVHIGLPKTGSTAIQTFLARNRERLLSQDADYLPVGDFKKGVDAQIASGNGAHLARSLLQPTSDDFLPESHPIIAKALQSLRQSPARRVILSSEHFAFASDEGWNRLCALGKEQGRDIVIVAVLRNHCDWISSSYIQLIRNHGVQSAAPEDLAEYYRRNFLLKYADYFGRLANIAGGHLILLSYDAAARTGSLIEHLKQALAIHGDHDDGFRINLTPSPRAVALLLACNAAGVDRRVSGAAIRVFRDAPPWTLLDRVQREEVGTHFAGEISAFMSRFGLAADFFSQPCENYVDVRAAGLAPSRIAVGGLRMLSRLTRSH